MTECVMGYNCGHEKTGDYLLHFAKDDPLRLYEDANYMAILQVR